VKTPLLIVAAAAALSSCTSTAVLPGSDWTTAYYDRNGDGRVDYALYERRDVHDAGWALIDSDFDGRYDTRATVGAGSVLSRVDRAVPTGVPITPGSPIGGGR